MQILHETMLMPMVVQVKSDLLKDLRLQFKMTIKRLSKQPER